MFVVTALLTTAGERESGTAAAESRKQEDIRMTFSVVIIEDNRPKVVGTVWASDESSARALAPAIADGNPSITVSIQRAEEREIPLRFCQSEPIPCFC